MAWELDWQSHRSSVHIKRLYWSFTVKSVELHLTRGFTTRTHRNLLATVANSWLADTSFLSLFLWLLSFRYFVPASFFPCITASRLPVNRLENSGGILLENHHGKKKDRSRETKVLFFDSSAACRSRVTVTSSPGSFQSFSISRARPTVPGTLSSEWTIV